MTNLRLLKLALLATALTAAPAVAQEHDHDHGAVDHSQMDHGDAAQPEGAKTGHDAHAIHQTDVGTARINMISARTGNGCQPQSPEDGGIVTTSCRLAGFSNGSGTSRIPGEEGGMHGLHIPAGDWMVMAHGYVSGQYTDHKGPRGDDLFYSTSMLMLSGEKETGWGRIQLRSMMSLEPTMAARGYPNLFATGETADGEPLVDRQHPHDLFMELAARIDINAGNGSVFLYGGPVGEPAIGPSAFMHRGSSKYNPEPPISHHWFDSTHIT